MARSRGRPVRPMPVHPERVLTRAVKAGLSATIRLQRSIVNKMTKEFYERSLENWSVRQQVYQITKERGTPDFSYISKAEASIRNNTRLIFYEKAARYGYTEVSRQKNADDTVDPLNQRFNACGTVVRENSETMFPLPDPIDFGTYTRRDGKGRKKYRRKGYEGSSFGPKVILAHPDLPSLDFGDAVRSHNEYLATICTIHNVPVRETTRYSHLFYLLVRPYLEYLYSEFKCGRANFQKGVNWALRQVKDLILDAGYRPTLYDKHTVTKELEFEQSEKKDVKTFFKRQENEARVFYGDHPAVVELSRLVGGLGDDDTVDEKSKSGTAEAREDDDSILTTKDVEHIRNEAAKRSRIAGSIMHRRISDLFSSPWHLNDIILSGDRYTHSSDYIIISEVPIQTSHGTGKVDLILCERAISDDGKRVFWRPAFVLEIKTRLGQSWYVDADYKESEVRPEGSSLQRVVPRFPLNDYPLSDNLWESIVQSTPTPVAHKQLEIYCQALNESYWNVAQQKTCHILRGVVVIDASSDITEVRKVLEQLIIHGYESVKSRVRRLRRTVFIPSKKDNCRVALVLDEQPGPKRNDAGLIKVPWDQVYTPFMVKTKIKRRFLLYLAGHSPTSAGQSAAWNARYYHGLQMLYEMKRTQKNANIIWIDLASQFNKPQLAEARLRLRPRGYSDEELSKVQPEHIREFFENIEVKGYLNEVLSFIYRDGETPSFELNTRKKKRLIVVTGADTLRDATPTSHRERLTVLLDHLLGILPDDENTIIVWFDSPVPSVEKALPYSSRALLPYYEVSSLGELVTEIIWNLPVAPKGAVQPDKWRLPIIGNSPMYDDIRVIIRHSPDDFQMELIHVPFLRGWSKRFRNKGTGLVTRERELDDIVPDRTARNQMKLLSLTMLPWLVKLWPQVALSEDPTETIVQNVSQLVLKYRGGLSSPTIIKDVLNESLDNSPSLFDLLRFRLPKSVDALSYQMMTAGRINSQRLYRSPRKLQTQPLQTISDPTPVQEVSAEEELEQEWVFGVKFKSEDEDILHWWMVVQDPNHPSRMLVGCFTDKPPDKNGFLWSETRHEVLNQQSIEGILALPQTNVICRANEQGLETWIIGPDGELDHAGRLEVKGRGYGIVGQLLAIKQTLTQSTGAEPDFLKRLSESPAERLKESLQRYHRSITSPTPVSVHLMMKDNVCQVLFQDPDDIILQDIKVEYTSDLIGLLRWPIAKSKAMYIDAGVHVTWNIFHDIDYGELEFIRPYVAYKAARTTPEWLPERVIQFFDESETIEVSIEHDHSICPLVVGPERKDHGACWRIGLPNDCPDAVRYQLGRPMTGEEINGLLAPGRLFTGRLYRLKVNLPKVSEKDESVVFHEERYIRMFLRGHDMILRRLISGTYLRVKDQKWIVQLSDIDSGHVRWSAQSTVTGLYFRGDHHVVELSHGGSASEECKKILEVITSEIPADRIVDYDSLKDQVLLKLKSIGYSHKSPRCEILFSELSDTSFKIVITPVGGSRMEPLYSLTVELTGKEETENVMDAIEVNLSEGEMSVFNIRGEDRFKKRLRRWLEQVQSEGDSDNKSDEPESWTVTLFVQDGGVYWEAETYYGDKQRSGPLYDDSKALLGESVQQAIDTVREIVEGDLIPHLEHIDNMEEVLKSQVLGVVREIRRLRS
ncbi:MAG: hypothetical protein RTU92_10160 [Candidatus Thorarchaeota archaeon]